jgi:EAL domain-containing protein (putative c-di-GMP-specific phosphodiesterase class I)
MHGRAMARLQFEDDLRRALDHGEFALHYQPVVDLGTGSLTAFEAFLRWQHPTRGLLHPDAFLPTAEECGVIVPISRWVMREACRQLRSWQVAGVVTPDVGISINISNRQFWHDDLLAVVTTCLRDTGLGARHLALEFTEAVLMNNPRQARMMLDELRKCGVKLQIDNFGTGCSSLESLHSFQVDTLKVDRSFIARLDDPRNAEVVRTMVVMGHNLGLTLIAVGVETAEQRAQLRGLGYTSGQGYLFSRPVAAAIAERVISDLSVDSATGRAVRSA